MKTFYLLIILSVTTLVCCGGEENPFSPCEDDFGCLNGEACIEGLCIPMECEVDTDCGDLETCTKDFKCESIWEVDQCLEEICYGDCESCGPYTSCYQGTCINACDAYNLKYRTEVIEACQGYNECIYCECRSQGLYTSPYGECGESIEPKCAELHFRDLSNMKLSLDNFSEEKEIIYNLLSIHCPQ